MTKAERIVDRILKRKAAAVMAGKQTPLQAVNLRRVAKRLRAIRHEQHYDQGCFANRTECGTAACIAGHACCVAGVPFASLVKLEDTRSGIISQTARAWLGLGVYQANRLFEPGGYGWPEPYRTRFCNARRSVDGRPSHVAADLLDAIADGTVLF